MNKKYKDNKLRLHIVILLLIVISTFFLSVGYASLESITLDINGKVTAIPESEVFISDIQYSTNVNADIEKSIIHQYYQTMIHNTVVLGEASDSSITYIVNIVNSSNETYSFKNIEYVQDFYDNPNIVYELDGLKQGDLLLNKGQITFEITFHYLNNTFTGNNVLNSYLNFKFVKEENPEEIADINNVSTNTNQIIIYNAEKDKVALDITNNNNASIDFNLSIDNHIIDTISLDAKQTKTIVKDIKGILSTLKSNKEYTVMVETAVSPIQKKETGIKIQVFPTITNYNFGLRTDGNEENPYLIYKIEDIVSLAQCVNSGNTFAGTCVRLMNNVDFNSPNDYYNSLDTRFGDLNGNAGDQNQIITEMTTGNGFIMIGNSETNSFQGTFEGNNARIDNIMINKTDSGLESRIGLFSYINNATIKNLTISGNYNIVKDGAGLIGGILGNSSIINCHNNVNITNIMNNFSVGGLVGTLMQQSNVIIDNSSNNATITNGSATGGLVGLVWNSVLTISNCNNTGIIISNGTQNQFTGGFVAKDNTTGATIILRNSINSGEVRGITNVDAFVGKCFGRLDSQECTNTGNIINGGLVKKAPITNQEVQGPINIEEPKVDENTIVVENTVTNTFVEQNITNTENVNTNIVSK